MATDYTTDFVSFYRDLVPVEGSFGPRAVIPAHLSTWLYSAFPLPAGHPAARNIGDFRTKKQGKSATAAGVALYMATRQRYAEVVIAASDQDQAKDRVLRAVKFAIDNGPLSAHAKVYRDTIEFDNGSLIQALPFDWKGASGGNYTCVIIDEMHTWILEQHRRMFDELVIPPTQPHGVRWFSTSAGYSGESNLLWDVWQKALAGARVHDDLPIYHNTEASILALIDVGPESWRMPWTAGASGAQYMREVQATERPNTFRRLWLNEWVSNESQFVTPEQWAACLSPEVQRLAEGDKRRLVLAGDASTSRDLTALCGTHYNSFTGKIEVLYSRAWTPKRGILRGGKPTVDLEMTIGAEVLRLHDAGLVDAVVIDPYQLHTLAIAWEKKGIKVIELPQTSGRVEADQALFDAIDTGGIVHIGDKVLTEHVLNAVALETPRGLRLAKEKTARKIDLAVALSMSHHGALQIQKVRDNVAIVYSPNPFYGDGDDDERFPQGWTRQQVGQRMIKVGKETVDAHPLTAEAVLKCRKRARGCATCMQFFEQSGEYAAQSAEAKAKLQDPGYTLPDLERWRQMPSEPPDRYRQFVQKFNLPKE